MPIHAGLDTELPHPLQVMQQESAFLSIGTEQTLESSTLVLFALEPGFPPQSTLALNSRFACLALITVLASLQTSCKRRKGSQAAPIVPNSLPFRLAGETRHTHLKPRALLGSPHSESAERRMTNLRPVWATSETLSEETKAETQVSGRVTA